VQDDKLHKPEFKKPVNDGGLCGPSSRESKHFLVTGGSPRPSIVLRDGVSFRRTGKTTFSTPPLVAHICLPAAKVGSASEFPSKETPVTLVFLPSRFFVTPFAIRSMSKTGEFCPL